MTGGRCESPPGLFEGITVKTKNMNIMHYLKCSRERIGDNGQLPSSMVLSAHAALSVARCRDTDVVGMTFLPLRINIVKVT